MAAVVFILFMALLVDRSRQDRHKSDVQGGEDLAVRPGKESVYVGETPGQEKGRDGNMAKGTEQEDKDSLLFFGKEHLLFLQESGKESFCRTFETYLRNNGRKASCCVILSNITPLSERTTMFYIQTNESAGNIYQILLNPVEDFCEITPYAGELADIEVYGGAGEGDTIERIYLYKNPEADKKIEVEMPTLEEETAAKEKEMEKSKDEMGTPSW